MGIKGIYGEIGPGDRVALSKLAVEKIEQTGRPFRVAIDVSIWQFQIQSGQGGTNPAIRTLYYRLLRLLAFQIQPLFVFDGPHKPPFKRNKKTGQGGAVIPNLMTKQLLKLFGYPIHNAPGEAEAECAFLQREGLVDAVLSEDVDTLMFGSGLTLRNWSSEGTRGNKSPTHVSAYDAIKTKAGKSGLDREGMILVALMSGGDYITEGIPGCGIKVACEAARAGYGKSLCRILRSDALALQAWREDLTHEIQTNEKKYFRVKHRVLKIPDTFPNKEVLGYYTHPVVSSASKIEKLKDELSWDQEVDVPGLRLFVAEAFSWTAKIGAMKFVRGLAPAMLAQKLRLRANRRQSGYGDIILTQMNEMELVRSICGRRTHITSDGISELRLAFQPLDIVGLDLDAEPDDSDDYGRDGLAPVNDDAQIESYQSDNDNGVSSSIDPSKRALSQYDPTQLDRVWIPETVAKLGVPLKVEDWERSQRAPKKKAKAPAKNVATKPATKASTKGVITKGTMNRFVKVSKSGMEIASPGPSKMAQPSSSDLSLPLALALENLPLSQPTSTKSSSRIRSTRLIRSSSENMTSKAKASTSRSRSKVRSNVKPQPNTSPWTLPHGVSLSHNTPAVNKATGKPSRATPSPVVFKQPAGFIDQLSSPPPTSHITPPLPLRKHTQSPTPSIIDCDDDFITLPKLRRNSSLTTPISKERNPAKPSPRNKISPASAYSPVLTSSFPEEIDSQSLTDADIARLLDFTYVANSPNVTIRGRKGRKTRGLPSFAEPCSPQPNNNVSPTNPFIIDEAENQIILSSSPVQTPTKSPKISGSLPLPKTSQQPMPGPLDDYFPTKDHEPCQNSQKPTEKQLARTGKKLIMLRDSLPGAWKTVNEEEEASLGDGKISRGKVRGGGRGVWRMSRVEVLDLCDD